MKMAVGSDSVSNLNLEISAYPGEPRGLNSSVAAASRARRPVSTANHRIG